ncbi:MAG: NfeD family protein [Ruaniaceae bacterium]|nr:NfeD family protein [Ruaniaceae bacterium]
MWMWWLAVGLIVGVVEMLTVDFIFIMFVGGALAAMIVALLGAPLWMQVVVFAVVSVALLLLARPPVKAWVARTTPDILTNAQALVGADARTLVEVTETGGRIKMRGEVWTARTEIPGDVIPPGTDVVVAQIDGAIAVVTRPQPNY